MKRRWVIIVAMLLSVSSQAQQIWLWQNHKGLSLTADPDRIWQYNRYEHSRWGLGITATYAPTKQPRTSHRVGIWTGWGTNDKRWKGGLSYEYGVNRELTTTSVSLTVADDVFPAGRLIVSSTADGLHGVVSNLGRSMMAHQQKVEASLGIKHKSTSYDLSATLFSEQRLYDSTGLLFGQEARQAPHYRGLDLALGIKLPQGLDVAIGMTLADDNATSALKALAYHRKQMRRQVFTTTVEAHAGVCSRNTTLHRRFCLGGSNGMVLSTEQAMASVRPDELWADAFALGMVHVRTTRPLVSFYNRDFLVGLTPTPFASVKAVWGTLWNASPDGSVNVDGMVMQAPDKGLIELGLGVDGLIKWGLTDWGVAVAWRLASQKAAYFQPEWAANVAVTLCARLIL